VAVQLSTALHEAVSDLDTLNKAAFDAGGGKQGSVQLGGALSIDALFALVRGRFHALGLENLLQRTTHTTDPGWVEATVTRLRRVVA
jgi:hypothetical protein